MSDSAGASVVTPDFQNLFEALPALYLVLTPDFTIAAVSDAYLQATMTQRAKILGRGLFDVFPDNPHDPDATGMRNLRISLERVLQQQRPDSMAVQKYDIRRPASEGGGFEERYWSPINSPLFGPDKKIRYIVHRVEDVTDFIRLKQKGAEQDELTQALRSHAEHIETELFLRAQEVQETSLRLEVANREMAALYERTKELDLLKSQFFANVSHELRTPLTLILGPVAALLHNPATDENSRAALRTIDRNARILLRHVNDLLDAAKIEAGRMSVHYQNADLAQLLRLYASHFEALAADRDIQLQVFTPSQLLAQTDVEKFERICLNLLSNAFKFVPPGGVVRCTLSSEHDRVSLSVADSGPGVPVMQREQIFERFRQGDGTTTRKVGGTGLGLSIVKDFLSLLSGQISVTDAEEGGARFQIELPLMAPAEANVQPASRNDEAFADLTMLLNEGEIRSPATAVRHLGSDNPLHPLVLIVEDNLDMSRFIAELLADQYRVAVANDGQMGLALIHQLLPDVVISDLMMPTLSGEQLLQEVRKLPALNAIPFLMLTARTDEQLRGQLLRAGAQDFLTKPFVAEELLARVANWIAIKRTTEVLQTAVANQGLDLLTLANELSVNKIALEHALVEQQHSNAQLRIQAEALATSNRYKSEFLATVSHELRTPLNCILILSEQLRRNAAGNLTAKQLMHSDVIAKAGADLLALINEILDLAKIESGQTRVLPSWFLRHDLIERLQSSLGPLAERKRLPLTITADPRLPLQLYSDHQRTYQILRNLIDNAIKFTEHGSIRVHFSYFEASVDTMPPGIALSPASTLVVRVTDTGIGVAPEQHETIFRAFQQVDGSNTRQFGGTGLGLTIARQLAALLGGEISVKSRLGMGSTFSLLLPLTSASVEPCTVTNDSATMIEPPQTTDAAISGAAQALSMAASNANPTRILVVDDDPRNVLAVSGLLEDVGYEVITAEHGEAALQVLAHRHDIDLVLMDMMMPVLDGYETTRILKQERACRIPIIALTARAMTGDKEKCLAAGSDAYLSKPIASEQLLATIKTCLTNS